MFYEKIDNIGIIENVLSSLNLNEWDFIELVEIDKKKIKDFIELTLRLNFFNINIVPVLKIKDNNM